ncbi:hypothetical protein P7C70_g6304, partial [Phenoliferia sp. Uapishka_3]
MAYQNNHQRHVTPLIVRPATSRPNAPSANQPQATSFLGNAIAGALGGMGMGMRMGAPLATWQPAGAPQGWGPGVPQYAHQPSQGMAHPLPTAPHLFGYAGGYQQSFQQQQPYFPPPQQFNQQFYPQPPPLGVQGPATPRTTAEGYTISSSYVAPPPEPPSAVPRRPTNPGTGRGGGNGMARGGARGGQGQGREGERGGGGGGGPTSKCSQAGCSFEGQRKAVREHEEDRHLIYAPGKEPKPWVGSYKAPEGVQIEGTSISLDSPEAIAKWIEERKKKWPSAKVVEVKVRETTPL